MRGDEPLQTKACLKEELKKVSESEAKSYIEAFIKAGNEHLHSWKVAASSLRKSFKINSKQPLNAAQYEAYKKEIERLVEESTSYASELKELHAFVWKSSKMDWIEPLNSFAQKLKLFVSEEIGSSGQADKKPSGLYLCFQQAYASIYRRYTSTVEVPSLTGIKALSIRTIQDCIENGLIPFFNDMEHYESYLVATKKRKKEYQSHLFNYVQRLLSQSGLSTVDDLKEASIFSKEMLKYHLEKNMGVSKTALCLAPK